MLVRSRKVGEQIVLPKCDVRMMKRIVVPVVIVTLTSALPSYGQQWAEEMFQRRSHDFGTIARGAKAEYAFVLENKYEDDVHIASVDMTCGCTTPRVEKSLLKTYEKGAIVAKINTDRFLGAQSSIITVTIDRPSYAQVRLDVKVQIRGDVEFDPPSVVFGNVDQGTSAEKTMTVTSHQMEGWKILGVRSPHPHLSGEATETGRSGSRVAYDLQLRVSEDAPAGTLRGCVLLETNDSSSKQLVVMVEGQIVPELLLTPSPIYLGGTKAGQKLRRRLVVRSKRPFRIQAIRTSCDCFEFDLPAPKSDPKKVYAVPYTFTAGDKPGGVTRTLRVETDLSETVAEVVAYALVKE